jgi:hypothetical protein
MKTLSGDVLQMSSQPSLLQTYLGLHSYDREMGKCWQNSNGTFHFKFHGNPSLNFPGNISQIAPAPSSSFTGTSNEGAVPWLYITRLRDPPYRNPHQISVIYQYYTAGGEPPSQCATVDQIVKTPYAAQYWVYRKQKRKKMLAVGNA